MEKIIGLLAGHSATVELLNGSDHEQFVAAAGDAIRGDWFCVRVDAKGRSEVPGFQSVGFDPGIFRCPWSPEAIKTVDTFPYVIDKVWRQSEIAMEGGWTLFVQSDPERVDSMSD